MPTEGDGHRQLSGKAGVATGESGWTDGDIRVCGRDRLVSRDDH